MFMLPEATLKIIRHRVLYFINFILVQLDNMYLDIYEKYNTYIEDYLPEKPYIKSVVKSENKKISESKLTNEEKVKILKDL